VANKAAEGIEEVDVLTGPVLRILPCGSDPEHIRHRYGNQYHDA
jgi:hypothetical protein